MAVSKDDVLHIAGLARIGVPADRVEALVRELNGILAHMDVLQKVPSAGAAEAAQNAHAGMPLRADAPPSVRLEHPRESFAAKMTARGGGRVPAMMDGFFLVPRLATHEDAGEES
jgi:aspartyl-tRNA(Asn)/glutamyl-tRNA(Gln) amidotransferase subunit C